MSGTLILMIILIGTRGLIKPTIQLGRLRWNGSSLRYLHSPDVARNHLFCRLSSWFINVSIPTPGRSGGDGRTGKPPQSVPLLHARMPCILHYSWDRFSLQYGCWCGPASSDDRKPSEKATSRLGRPIFSGRHPKHISPVCPTGTPMGARYSKGTLLTKCCVAVQTSTRVFMTAAMKAHVPVFWHAASRAVRP